MQSYHHFTQSERNCLAQMHRAGKSYREIGIELGKHASSICRELQRNRSKGQVYRPQDAFVRYCRQRRNCVRLYRLETRKEERAYVEEKLAQFWSPATIAGRWKQEKGSAEQLSASTIYRAIHAGRLAGYNPRTHLRRRGIPYKPSRSRFYAIQPDHMIRELPAEAVYRKQIGHWEGDTISGCRGSGGLLSLIDRKSRLCVLRIIPDMSAGAQHWRSSRCIPYCWTTDRNLPGIAILPTLSIPSFTLPILTRRGNGAAMKTTTVAYVSFSPKARI